MEFLDAERTVALTAAHCRVEQLLFSTIGSWAPSIEVPAARVAAVELSDHAGWRAQRWFELLPTAPPGPDALIVDRDTDREFAGLVVRSAGSTDAGRFALVAEVLLPMVRDALTGLIAATEGSVAHGPIRRIATIARTDVESDLMTAIGILERITADPASRDLAARAAGELAADLARSGGPLTS